MKKTILRWSVYLLGMLSLAFGIVLSMKTGLGNAPISSVAISISEIWEWNLGVVNFVVYAIFIAAQFILRGKNSKVIDLLQLLVSVIFSWALNLFKGLIPYTATQPYSVTNIAMLLVSIVFIGIGVSASVNMRLIPNPGDGIVFALTEKIGWEHGTTKNVFDISCVCLTTIISLVFAGKLVGVGVGTVVAMLGVGRVVALVNRLLKQKVYIPLTTKE